MAENTSSWHSAGDANTLNEFEKLKIWGKTTPGNSKRRKSEVMDIRKGLLNNDTINLIRFFMALSSRKVTIKGKRMIDTYTDS